jgi:hypothetical protein
VSSKVFNTIPFPVFMFHLNGHVNNIPETVQRSPTTCTRRLSSRLGVSRTRVWRILHDDGLYPFYPERAQNLRPGDRAMRLEFCHWLLTNRQLLPLILFTDEATFTHNGISNSCNSHRWSHDNINGAVDTTFLLRFFHHCVVRYD